MFVLAGSLRCCGAGLLCAHAALRSGAGLVTWGVARCLALPLIRRLPAEVMLLPLPQTREKTLSVAALPQVKEFFGRASVCAVGPGLSRNESTANLVRKAVLECTLPLVLDADGINAFSGHLAMLRSAAGRRQRKTPMVITPHPGEMARLLGRKVCPGHAERINVAKSFASEYNCVTVLKGHRSVVADPSGVVYSNTTGNAGMATAGSGDVLTGIIAGFLAIGMPPFEAARYGVYMHGLAGDLAASRMTQIGLTASDIIASLPDAIRRTS